MRAVDTNVLVRLVARDDANQLAAAEQLTASGAWVSQLVLVETVWVLSSVYGLGSSEISIAVDMLLKHVALSIQDADVVEEALSRFRARPSVQFRDCLILEVARKAGHL